MSSLRDFLKKLEKRGEVVKIKREVSAKFEVAAITKRLEAEYVVLFRKIKESSIPVVVGVCGNKDRVCRALGVKNEASYEAILQAINKPKKAMIVEEGEVKEVLEAPDLNMFPILTHYEKDGGPYITSAVVSVKSPDGKFENVSIHRLQVLDRNHLAIRIVPRHLYKICQMAQSSGSQTLDVAISLGVHPAVMLAAATPAPFGVSEFDIANTMLRGELKLVKCENVDVHAPANAEIVFEGKILLDREVPEGPLADIIGTYDTARLQPVVELIRVMHRKNCMYQALLPSGSEHKILMGLAREAKIWETVRNMIPTVKSVKLTDGGCGWLHAAISIKKQLEGDGKNAVLAAFTAHSSLKHVFVVDEDIDIDNPSEIEWALATRFQGDEDLIVIENARGSTLDPSGDQKTGLTTKIGFDATRPLSKPIEHFEKVCIPESLNVKHILSRIHHQQK